MAAAAEVWETEAAAEVFNRLPGRAERLAAAEAHCRRETWWGQMTAEQRSTLAVHRAGQIYRAEVSAPKNHNAVGRGDYAVKNIRSVFLSAWCKPGKILENSLACQGGG